MGRKLNISNPTVINTELAPFDESFYVSADGQTEQWYYDNTAVYAPNRKLTPLTLTPHLSVFDMDTKATYSTEVTTVSDPQHLAFQLVQWYALEYDSTAGDYVETLISNTTDSTSADYVKTGNNLLVKKNVSYSHGVTIRCVATYIDPRDAGITYTTQYTTLLTTNRDGNVIFPEVAITSPSARSFNPLLDYDGQGNQQSQYTFDAVVTNNPERADMGVGAKYKADGWGTEEILPSNDGEQGLVSCAPTVDIRYGDGSLDTDAEFVYRPTANGEHLDIGSGYRTITWNQLVQNGNFADGTTGWNSRQGSESIVSTTDGLELLCVSTTDIMPQIFESITIETSHKYYASFRTKKNDCDISEIRLRFKHSSYSLGTTITRIYNPTTTWKRASGIASPEYVEGREYNGISLMPVGYTNDADNKWYVDDIVLVDLTLLYGEGNEPTTAAAFEADYERWFGHPLVYEPYNAGETMRVYDGEGYKTDFGSITTIKGNTVVWNQLIAIPSSSKSKTVYDVTITDNRDGSYTASTESTGATENASVNLSSSIIEEHVYLLKGCPAGGSSNTYCMAMAGMGRTQSEVGEGLIFTATTTSQISFPRMVVASGAVITTPVVFKPILIDLSLIYGLGNEPETVAEFEADFEKWFGHPLVYEAYNEGELIPVTMTGLKTTGFNQWDEEWEVGGYDANGQKVASSNKIRSTNRTRVFPNTAYMIVPIVQNLCGYDIDGKFVGMITKYSATGGQTFLTPENVCYIAFNMTSNYGTTYNHNICVNLAHDNSRNGEYEPHWEMTRELDVKKFYGKLNGQGEYVQCFPDGMKMSNLAGTNRDVADLVAATADVKVGSRSYTSGDDSGTTVITDGTNTYYALTTVLHYTDLVYRENGRDIPVKEMNIANFVWYGIENGVEVKMGTSLPYYVSGQGTSQLVVDAMWKENINVVLRATMDTATETLSPSKAYASVSWRIPDVDTHVVSQNGDAVRSDTTSMTFSTICNAGGTTLTDTVKNAHMRFNWKYRKDTVTTETDAGWGLTKTISAENLKNVRGSASSPLASTLVFPYVYVLGAWEQQTSTTPVDYDQPSTTKNGVTYVRTIPLD